MWNLSNTKLTWRKKLKIAGNECAGYVHADDLWMFSLRPPQDYSSLTNSSNAFSPIPLVAKMRRWKIYKLGNAFVSFAAWGLIYSNPANVREVDRGSWFLKPVMKHVSNTRSCLLAPSSIPLPWASRFPRASSYTAQKQCESALRASPRDFFHFVFAIRHHNARHTAIEIALILEKVKVAPSLVIRVIGLLLLTGVIDKLSAFPEIDMSVECLTSIWFFQKLHVPNLPRGSKA